MPPVKTKAKLVNRGPAGLLSRSGDHEEAVSRPPATHNNVVPALRGLMVDVEKLIPDPANARLHPERNLESIVDSLNLYGQRTPLVVNMRTMHIEKGNGTYAAATSMGWTKIAAIFVDDPEHIAAGYGLADNRTAELARWDFGVVQKLEKLVAEEAGAGAMVGWTIEELEALRMMEFGGRHRGDGEEAPPPPAITTSRRGDLWTLGRHRLLCGDSALGKDVRRLMQSKKGWLMATDPPYGIEFGKANYNPTAKEWAPIEGDARRSSELRGWFTEVIKLWTQYLQDQSCLYIWSASLGEGHRFYEAIEDTGWHVQGQVIWSKNVFALGQSDFQWCHESAWYAFKKGKKHRWFGGRDKRTVWDVSKVPNSAYLHPTQKPLELYERPLEYHTKEGELVVEPFAGSGTQFIACEKMNRTCYGMELDPVYVDVTLARWADFTGKDPVRHDGKRWSQLKGAKK